MVFGRKRKIVTLAMCISLLLVLISFTLGPVFQQNMGFTILPDFYQVKGYPSSHLYTKSIVFM